MADPNPSPPAQRELLERALGALREMRGRLEAAEQRRPEPIAVIGLACRFPGGCATPEAFWELLHAGSDAVGPAPVGRWPDGTTVEREVRTGGFLREDVAGFDAHFFSISPREAQEMDPQHRLLLETSWEAMERAGLDATAWRGRRAGVFVGVSGSEYGMLPRAPGTFSPYTATGLTSNLASGRLAYFFGFQGPAVSLDTACSSSLVAVHLASRSLQSGDCELALAAGVNLLLAPQPFDALRSLGALAADGRCKTFSAAADGYGRGEGCGVVVLKRLAQAQADGDPILAVIRGSAVNQDGASSGLTVPNGLAQQALLREALANAGMTAAEIDLLELHGTGTALGDPIEVQAITEVHRGRTGRPLCLGAVKSTLGHLEAAAGIAGLIKVVLSLQQRTIPPQRVAGALNPRLNLAAIPAVLPETPLAWESGARPRCAAISSFGFSGTNAHLILMEPAAAVAPGTATPAAGKDAGLLLKVCADSELALRELAGRHREFVETHAALELADYCWSANVGRAVLPWRLAIVVRNREQLVGALRAFAEDREHADLCHGHVREETVAATIGAEETDLRTVAQRFVEGRRIDWSTINGGGRRKKISVPTYPFQNRRYWLPGVITETATQVDRASADAGLHPRRIEAATSEEAWEFVLGWGSLADLGDNQGVLHVGHYHALVASAAASAHAGEGWCFSATEFLFLLRVPESGVVRVQVVLAKAEHGRRLFRVCSRGEKADAWTLHVRGEIAAGGGSEAPLPGEEPEAVIENWSGETFYGLMREQGFAIGPGLQLLSKVERGAAHACGWIEAAPGPAGSALPVAPAVFDVCAQLLFAAARSEIPARTTFMVARCDQLIVCGQVAAGPLQCRMRVRSKETTGTRVTRVLVDYRLETIAGELVAAATGMEFQLLAADRLMELQRALAAVPAIATTAPLASRDEATLREILTRAVSAALRVPALELDCAEPLRRLGVDSIVSLDIKARVEREAGGTIPVEALIVGPSINELARQLAQAGATTGRTGERTSNPWLVREARRPDAKLRLFCVPSGALGASQYAGWSARLPDDIEVCALQLPGREERFGDTPIERLDDLLAAMETALAGELDRPYAFYGHSMGALIAYRLAHRLWQRAAIKPVHLFPGAYTAPVMANPIVEKYRRRFEAAGLPGIPGPRDRAGHAIAAGFVREGLAATTALNTGELAGALLPTMLADMKLVQDFVHDPAEARFDVPITAFHGAKDADVTRAETERWRELTTGKFECRVVPGDHFFMHADQDRDQLVAAIAGILLPATAGSPRS